MDLLSVRLFHGRKHPDEKLDDWGFDGPCLGPFSGVHLTYQHVGVFAEHEERLAIPHVEDLLFYGGGYFGDASIRSVSEQPPTAQIDERLTAIPSKFEWRVRRPVVVPRSKLREYLRRVDVFADSVRELVGDAAADAARDALSRAVKAR